MIDQDVEHTRLIDGLVAARDAAAALDDETLIYLIGIALDETMDTARARNRPSRVRSGTEP